MRHGTILRTLMCVAMLCVFAASARGQGTEGDKPGEKPKPEAPPAGPAARMKILEFVTLETQGILRIQFLDRKGNPTAAPEGGEINYSTNITNPRKGTVSMTKATHRAKEKEYVLSGLAPRQRIICPPRVFTVNVQFKAGKQQMRASLTTKLNCI